MFVEAVKRVFISRDCNLCYENGRLLVDFLCDTPHVFQFTVVSLQLSSRSQSGHDPYLCRHLGARFIRHTSLS